MEFTGERYVPSVDGQIKYEHLHRYALSLALAEGKSVLDIACGEGYGSALLARVARSVVGVDIDATALNHARQSYYDENLNFLLGSCDSIPLPDHSVELVTSFETIEHHDKHEEMMLEIKRVLKPDGFLIISSPNRFVYSDEPKYVNEHHVKELYYDELIELLNRHFKHVRCDGQRLATGSFVFPLSTTDRDHYVAYSGDARLLTKQVYPLQSPVYFIALCSDASLPKARLASVYLDGKDDLLKKLEAERLNHINQLQLQVQRLEETVAAERTSTRNQLANQDYELERVRAKLGNSEAELAQRAMEVTNAQKQIWQHEADLERARTQLAIYEGQIAQQTAEFTSLRKQIGQQEADLERARTQLAVYESQLAQALGLTSACTNISQQAAELEYGRTQLTGYEGQLAQRTADMAEQFEEIKNQRANLLELQKQLARHQEQLKASRAQTATQATSREKAEASLFGTQLQLRQKNEVLDWILTSRAWRLVALVRSCERLAYRIRSRIPGQGRVGIIGALQVPTVVDSDSFEIVGWVFSTEALITRVEAFLDNQFVGVLSYHVARPDVVAEWPEKAPLRCGYKQRLLLDDRMVGSRLLTVRVFDGRGKRQLYMSQIQIRPSSGKADLAPAPPALDIDAAQQLVISEAIGEKNNQTVRPAVTLKTSAAPVLSVVIPVFNKSSYTFNCLSSIRNVLKDEEIKVEIIVVDDASIDDTSEMLAQITGIRILTNEQNLGFIDSCNRGAAIARGQYLLFLNNDTLVSPNCFEELLRTFQIKADVGLVGAKLLYPDGRLQEAGGIIWNDASGWNYGRLDDPEKPEYCYLREVDYCSGACIMIPRQLFNQLRGFDTRYRPAYYEDADLAFQVRQAGYGVYYQPLAQVTHFEGITSGTDVSTNVKTYQVVNQRKFLEKWEDVLATHGESGVNPSAAKERKVAKRILVLDACVLTPDQDAGSLMVFNHIKIFQGLGYKVTFIPINLHRDQKYTANLQRIGVECLYWPQTNAIKDHLETFGDCYDFVFITRAEVAEKYCDDVKACSRQARIIFNTIDLHFIREQRQAELENNSLLGGLALRRKELELTIAAKSDCTLVVSSYEEEVLRRENPCLNVSVVPMTLEMPGRQADFAERADLLYIGGFQHTPNVDAVLYFVQTIYPAIKVKLPEIRFYIVGSKPPDVILDLAGDSSIVVTGYLEDVAPYFNRCRLSVAPIRYGAGLKGKVITSLSYGLPMVASPIACEGIGLQDGIDVLIANNPAEFVEKVVRLYTDAALWNQLSSAGFEKVHKDYSADASRSYFERLFISLRQRPKEGIPVLSTVEQKLAAVSSSSSANG